MKVLQVNVVYNRGSTGKIVRDIHEQLIFNGHESIVCYGRGEQVSEKHVYKIAPEYVMKLQSIRSKATGYAYSGCLISTRNIIKIIEKEKPDVVHLHCLNGFMVNVYKLLKYLQQHGIKTVLTLHAEFMYTAGCGYALDCNKWKTGCGQCPQKASGRPSSRFFDRSSQEWRLMGGAFEEFNDVVIVPVSPWLGERAKQSPFFAGKKIQVIKNGIDTLTTFKPTDYSNLKSKHNIDKEKIILHVTSNFADTIKGGQHVLSLAERLKHSDIKIIVVGYSGSFDNLPENVIPVKYTENQLQLAEYYTMASITLLTSKRETFSMICAESLACGTPVVGFQAGAPETISIKKYSEFVEEENINLLEAAVRRWLNKKDELSVVISEDARKIYSKELMFKQYYNIYEGLGNK